MSRSYIMRVPVNLGIPEDAINKMGRLKLRFDLLQVLDADRMKEILEKVLTEKGWKKTDEGLVKETKEKTRWIVHPEKQEIEVDVTETLDKEVEMRVDEDFVKRQGYLEGLLKEQIGRIDHAARRRLIAEMAQAREELNKQLKDVYRESIKEKAASLGNVTSVAESSEGGNYRIRLEIQ